MTRTCTWVECTEHARYHQTAADGEIWADLCKQHNDVLVGAAEGKHAPRLVSAWIRAQGGAKKAAMRVVR